MINVLLDFYNIDEPWIKKALCDIIKPSMKVAVVAFSFRDEYVKNEDDWQKLYGEKQGKTYLDITRPLKAYGISRENISVINYFSDTKESAEEKIKNADILYFTGGLPDRMFERIKDFGIYDALTEFDGIVMGYSAGALVQMKEYYLSQVAVIREYFEKRYEFAMKYLTEHVS